MRKFRIGHAFISYDPQDTDAVDRLQLRLEAAGIPVWRDISMLPGDNWRAQIRRAITDDALVFLACFSGNSLARKARQQNEELTLAIDQMRARPPDKPWLIPVRFDNCPIPDWDIGGGRTLGSILPADLWGEHASSEIERLITSIVRILDGATPEATGTGARAADPDLSRRPAAGATSAARAVPDRPIGQRVKSWDVAIRAAWIGGACVIVAALIALVPYFLSGTPTGTPRATARHRPRVTAPPPTTPEKRFQDPGGTGVLAVAFGPGGSLAVGDTNGVTYLRDVATQRVIASLRNPDGEAVFAAAFSPAENTLAVGTENSKYDAGGIYLWDVPSRKVVVRLADPDGRGVDGVAFSPGGGTLAAADNNGSVYLWNVRTRALIATLRDHASQSLNAVAFSPGGGTLAAADNNGSVYLWNVRTRTLIAAFGDPASKGVNGVAFTPDGRTLAAADINGSVYLWNVRTLALNATIRGPGGQGVQGVAFSRGGQILAGTTTNSANTRSSICVWDAATGKRLATLHDPDSQGNYRLAFSPDGSTLAVGDSNARAYLWSMTWLGP